MISKHGNFPLLTLEEALIHVEKTSDKVYPVDNGEVVINEFIAAYNDDGPRHYLNEKYIGAFAPKFRHLYMNWIVLSDQEVELFQNKASLRFECANSHGLVFKCACGIRFTKTIWSLHCCDCGQEYSQSNLAEAINKVKKERENCKVEININDCTTKAEWS